MKDVLLCAAIVVLTFLGMVLAIDALEWEQTGECYDCLVLNKIRPALRAPEFIAGE